MPGLPQRRLLLRLVMAGLIALGLALPLIPVTPLATGAYAQEVRERRSIIDLLFGRTPKYEQTPSYVRVKKKKHRPASDRPSDTAAAAAEEPTVAKTPDAKKVLVIGDFMATALADGLTMATAEDADLQIEKGSDGSSGLVRTDHLDWPKTLKQQIDSMHPALIVIMLGSNDRQQMTVDGVKQKFRTEAWNNEYERRISQLIDVAKSNKIPFIWTGLPSFQQPSLSADAASLNTLYREKVEAAGGVFIDIWDGFADEEGKFIATGSDINGQPVRLRGSDGLSLTKAGKRKMAFYLERDLRRLTGTDEIANLIRLDSADLPNKPASTTPTVTSILTVPPMSLADPELDGAKQLLDSNLLPKTSGTTPRDLLIEKGETEAAPEGRVDDFRWKGEKPAG